MKTNLMHNDIVESNRILSTPSDFAKNNLFYLQEIGQLQAQQNHIKEREDLASYLFFVVLSGSGTLTYDGNTYTLNSGDCVFIDCSKPYSHETSEQLWQLKWIHFYGANIETIYHKYIEQGGQTFFQPTNLSIYLEIWKKLFKAASATDLILEMQINENIAALLKQLMTDCQHKEITISNTKKMVLFDIKDYLDTHYPDKITLDDLSEAFFINKFYLTRIFKEHYGVTINNYLLQIRITHAKQLLRFSSKTI